MNGRRDGSREDAIRTIDAIDGHLQKAIAEQERDRRTFAIALAAAFVLGVVLGFFLAQAVR